MATKTIKWSAAGIKELQRLYNEPFNYTAEYFKTLSIHIHKTTLVQFKLEGARDGLPKWRGFSINTLRTPRGTWKLRYGSWKGPKKTREELNKYKTANKLWYKPGPMKGYRNDKRYSPQSKLLQASGTFRNSFVTLKLNNRMLEYGTKYKKAEKILSGGRQVLFVTRNDEIQFTKDWTKFFNKYLWR